LNFETFSSKPRFPTNNNFVWQITDSAFDTAFTQIHPLDTSKLLFLPLVHLFSGGGCLITQPAKLTFWNLPPLNHPTMLFISINTVSIVDVTSRIDIVTTLAPN
jgi:hypothetical protein